MSKELERHMQYSAAYADSPRAAPPEAPSSAGLADRTIAKRKAKYGDKTLSKSAPQNQK